MYHSLILDFILLYTLITTAQFILLILYLLINYLIETVNHNLSETEMEMNTRYVQRIEPTSIKNQVEKTGKTESNEFNEDDSETNSTDSKEVIDKPELKNYSKENIKKIY